MGFKKGRGCGRCKGEARRDRVGTIKSISLVQKALDNAGRDRRTGLTVKRGTGEQVRLWGPGGLTERRNTEEAERLGWGVRAGSRGEQEGAWGFALTPGGGRGRQALPAWYRGVWCPLLRPLKKLAALEFSVRKAFSFEVEASKSWSSRLPHTQPR